MARRSLSATIRPRPPAGARVIRREVAIVGIGQTAYGKALPGTAWDLAIEAILAALADAGLEPRDVDGMCRFAPPFELVSEPMLVRALGLPELRFFAESPLGGEALGGCVAHAAAAIVAGLARIVVVYRALSQSRRAVRPRRPGGPSVPPEGDVVVPEEAQPVVRLAVRPDVARPAVRAVGRPVRHVHGLTDEDLTRALGSIAITQRAYASKNPSAMMRDRKMDWDDYRGARMISEPLRLFDLCLENDGACAYVVTSAAVARAARRPGLRAVRHPDAQPLPRADGHLRHRRTARAVPAGLRGATVRRGRGGPGVMRRRVLRRHFLYAAAVPGVLRVRSRRPGLAVRDGDGTGQGSPLPVNTHGGHLSEAYLHGMNGVLEAVRQLRGTAINQVPGAEVALVGAPAGSAMILAR